MSRIFLVKRSMVSMLCETTSGPASIIFRSANPLPLKSGTSTSIIRPGHLPLTSRMHSAKCPAPSSSRSSRATEVITTYRRSRDFSASASFFGSSGSSGGGLDIVLMAQNLHPLVQCSPMTMNVAVPWDQHSERLGQWALWHTECRLRLSISFEMWRLDSLSVYLILNHSGSGGEALPVLKLTLSPSPLL